jgi:hypothetical protein
MMVLNKIGLTVILLLTASCGTVSSVIYERAVSVCKGFGGVDVVWANSSTARCKDGTEIMMIK